MVESTLKLYLIHCGFYDPALMDGLYESHANFFVVAESFEDARAKAKLHADYKKHRMHVDGIQEINVIGGYTIKAEPAGAELAGQDRVISLRHRELAPSASNQPP